MNTRVLALDIGDSKIGVAVSDPQGILARPLTILRRSREEEDFRALLDLAAQNQVAQIVVGLPRSLDGSIGGQAEKVRTFAERLRLRTEIPMIYRDERLTTVSAKRLLREQGKPRDADDAIAAAFLLQSYLDESVE